MKAKYTQRKDGECFEVPVGEKYRISCCDCGLVHDVVFLLDDEHKLHMATQRNNRATAQKRRKINIHR